MMASTSSSDSNERRQEETGSQDVTDAGGTLDRCALRHQIGDVPIDRSFGNLQGFGQLRGGDRLGDGPAVPEADEEGGLNAT